jgi:CO/xanthine dehydrogenase Mo-binding subunit
VLRDHRTERIVVGRALLHDAGRSLNPAIDIGQIEGGFVQGMGWLTTEQLVWNDKGHLATHAPSTYKIPATGDIPQHLRVELWPEPNREDNVFGSKAVAEQENSGDYAALVGSFANEFTIATNGPVAIRRGRIELKDANDQLIAVRVSFDDGGPRNA